jgi:hypothetical protein
MVTTEQSERLLGQVVRGVRLEMATDALGISDLELLAKLQSDAAFQISLELAMQASSRYARVLLQHDAER